MGLIVIVLIFLFLFLASIPGNLKRKKRRKAQEAQQEQWRKDSDALVKLQSYLKDYPRGYVLTKHYTVEKMPEKYSALFKRQTHPYTEADHAMFRDLRAEYLTYTAPPLSE